MLNAKPNLFSSQITLRSTHPCFQPLCSSHPRSAVTLIATGFPANVPLDTCATTSDDMSFVPMPRMFELNLTLPAAPFAMKLPICSCSNGMLKAFLTGWHTTPGHASLQTRRRGILVSKIYCSCIASRTGQEKIN